MTFRGLSIALLLCVCADAAWRVAAPDEVDASPRFAVPSAVADTPLQCSEPLMWQQVRLPMPAGAPAAHASALVSLEAPHPMAHKKSMAAFWFAGTRESGSDVGIAAATFDRQRQTWDDAQWVVTREMLQAQLGVAVRRIGNPVAWRDPDGRLHLYVVATGLGGWAASRVVHLVEAVPQPVHHAWRFVAERVMPLMPLATWFNTSTLVRAVPQPLQDGGALLPLYFELGTKYAMAVRVGPQGQLRDIRRLSERRDVLQPTLVAVSETQAWAFMRDSGPHARVAWTQTGDAGLQWHDQPDAEAGNPDSSLAAVRLPSGEVLVAHNPVPERRSVLLLSRVRDPQQPWSPTVLVKGEAGSEYSYPSMLWLDGAPAELAQRKAAARGPVTSEVWVSYTDQRQAISFARLVMTCQPEGMSKGAKP